MNTSKLRLCDIKVKVLDYNSPEVTDEMRRNFDILSEKMDAGECQSFHLPIAHRIPIVFRSKSSKQPVS